MRVFKVKTWVLVFVMMLSFCAFPLAYNAAEKSVEEKYEEITDLNILFSRAINGVSDLPDHDIKVLKERSNSESAKSSLHETKEYATTQLLERKNVLGKPVETYSTTVFQITQDEEDRKNQQLQDDGYTTNGSRYDDAWDSTIGVKAYATITWNTSTKDKLTYYGLTKVTGGWTLSTGYTLSNYYVRVGQVGTTIDGGYVKNTKDLTVTNMTYSYNVPTTWKPVAKVDGNLVGVSTNVTITRGTSSWKHPFNNHAF